MILYRQPGANVIETVDRARALLPELQASIPSDIEMRVALDQSTTIRSSLREVERALMISIALVIMVVLRSSDQHPAPGDRPSSVDEIVVPERVGRGSLVDGHRERPASTFPWLFLTRPFRSEVF